MICSHFFEVFPRTPGVPLSGSLWWHQVLCSEQQVFPVGYVFTEARHPPAQQWSTVGRVACQEPYKWHWWEEGNLSLQIPAVNPCTRPGLTSTSLSGCATLSHADACYLCAHDLRSVMSERDLLITDTRRLSAKFLEAILKCSAADRSQVPGSVFAWRGRTPQNSKGA